MMLQTLKTCYMWCCIINGGLMIIWAIFLVFARDWAYGIHNKWFPMSKQTHTILMFSFMGVFKMFFIVFNLTPYIVLLIMN